MFHCPQHFTWRKVVPAQEAELVAEVAQLWPYQLGAWLTQTHLLSAVHLHQYQPVTCIVLTVIIIRIKHHNHSQVIAEDFHTWNCEITLKTENSSEMIWQKKIRNTNCGWKEWIKGDITLKEPSIQIWSVSLDTLTLDLCEMLNTCLCCILYSESDTKKIEPFKKRIKKEANKKIHHPLTHYREKQKQEMMKWDFYCVDRPALFTHYCYLLLHCYYYITVIKTIMPVEISVFPNFGQNCDLVC